MSKKKKPIQRKKLSQSFLIFKEYLSKLLRLEGLAENRPVTKQHCTSGLIQSGLTQHLPTTYVSKSKIFGFGSP